MPFAQYPHIFGTLAVRTPGDPMSYAASVRQAVWNVDKDQPVWKVRTMESLVDMSVTNRRLLARLMSDFSAFALLLAAIGLYGAAGLALGLAGAIPASGLLRNQLFQVRVTDVEPYLIAVLALIGAALLATAIPARRVAAINVSDILRQD
ncbi:MAG: hypothetical protein ACREUZ_12970 [Burkholderiales bacterium]